MKLKMSTLRGLVISLIGLIIVIGFVTKVGIGNLSAGGIYNISAICPLGVVETALAAKLLIPRALIPLLFVVILIIVFGRFFCAWVCPVPLIQYWFPGRKEKAKEVKEATDAVTVEADNATAANVATPTKAVEKKPNNIKLDSRHAILGGALASSAIFGFPVFCLVCPVGLTFATILTIMRLFSNGETTIAVIVFPLIIIIELLLLRKWCSKICPLGAMISLVAGLNKFFRPTIDDEKCLVTAKGVDCNVCANACPDNLDPRRPAESERAMMNCTKCRECAQACPTNAIKFPVFAPQNKTPDPVGGVSAQTAEAEAGGGGAAPVETSGDDRE